MEATRVDVSVVVPTRNRRALLAVTLHSVLGQRNVALEVIVVDEGSTDGTSAALAAIDDRRVRVIRHEAPQGVSAARNRGAADARADWVAFVDDDDLWAPNKLELQIKAAHERGATWAYVGHVNINMAYRVTGGAPPLAPAELLEELPQRNVVPGGCSGVIASKRALELAGPFDTRLQPLADWDLWIRLARIGMPACVTRPLVAYRLHDQQMSLDAARVEADFRLMAADNPDGDMAALYRYLGWWALRVKDYRQAARCFLRAWKSGRPDYGARALAGDLAFVARHVAVHSLGIRMPSLEPVQALSEEQRAWRLEAQEWVNALVADSAPSRDHVQRPG